MWVSSDKVSRKATSIVLYQVAYGLRKSTVNAGNAPTLSAGYSLIFFMTRKKADMKMNYLLEVIMNKLELVSALIEKTDLSRPEALTVVDLFVDNMADALVRGDRVEIRGLCSFSVKKYKSYIGRNPKTGEKVAIKTKKLPFFKAGRDLRLRVNR